MVQRLPEGRAVKLAVRKFAVRKSANARWQTLRHRRHDAATSLAQPLRRCVIAGRLSLVVLLLLSGCTLIPESRQRDVLHNPFPQLKRVAVLPFFNQSHQPSIDGKAVAQAYYAALQAVPGFEVYPVGVTDIQLQAFSAEFGPPQTGQDFQRLAQFMGVEAIVVGSVTDFEEYYPPRLALTVRWYAANEGFHAIPPGYGLPWGTDEEESIPRRIVREAEFELARSQMQTQTPVPAESAGVLSQNAPPHESPSVAVADFQSAQPLSGPLPSGPTAIEGLSAPDAMPLADTLPVDWPDPTDLIPDGPSPMRPVAVPNHDPVLTHTRLYRGDDPYVTQRLADYVETGDDARGTSWQGYVRRSDDFIRFCCHLHLTEMLEARGGRDASDLILRWPVSRY